MNLNLGSLPASPTASQQEIRRKTLGSPGRKKAAHKRGDSTDRSDKNEKVDSEEARNDRRKSAPQLIEK